MANLIKRILAWLRKGPDGGEPITTTLDSPRTRRSVKETLTNSPASLRNDQLMKGVNP